VDKLLLGKDEAIDADVDGGYVDADLLGNRLGNGRSNVAGKLGERVAIERGNMNADLELVILDAGLDGRVLGNGTARENRDETRGDVVAADGGDAVDLARGEGDDRGDDALGDADTRNAKLVLGH
jgi:hypothetical protein